MDLADIGCGTGRLHDFLSGQFRSLTGVDVSEKSLAVARESHPGNTYFSYSGGRLPLESRSADLALAVCVLHHVPPGEWTSFAAEMIRILRPGGFALVIEHNPWNPITRRIVSRCPLDEDAVLLSKKDLAALFDGESIDRVLSRSILSVPAFSATMRRVDSLFGRLPFGAQHFCLARKSKAS
jgi:SAM-dependent methyltransferase